MDNKQLIIASINPCRIFDTCTEENKKIKLEKAINQNWLNMKKFSSHLKDGKNIKYWQKLIDSAQKTRFKIMTAEQYAEAEKNYILSLPIREISENEYFAMFDLLPCLTCKSSDKCIMFCLYETITATYVKQYCEKNGRYYTKIVDYLDSSTWLYNFV